MPEIEEHVRDLTGVAIPFAYVPVHVKICCGEAGGKEVARDKNQTGGNIKLPPREAFLLVMPSPRKKSSSPSSEL
jgi:hypothetical protein